MVGDDEITGTLKYVTGYTGFSSKPAEQKGNYIALKVNADEEAVVKVQLVGGKVTKDLMTLDEDRNFVFLISDKEKQSIKVVVESGGKTKETVYGLSGLTLETAETV